MYQLKLGNSLELLKTLEENSVDSIVTDPPYELGFMGKSWDKTGIANNVELWKECLRVLKPGGHLLAFSGTRTYHRMASAIEDAGFEVRDMIEWVYGSGFPKSLNIGKAVDKLLGNKGFVKEKDIEFIKWLRNGLGQHKISEIDEILGTKAQAFHYFALSNSNRQIPTGDSYKKIKDFLKLSDEYDNYVKEKNLELSEIREVTGYEKAIKTWNKPYIKATLGGAVYKEAKKWEGWGTSLKPSHEPICMARKPLAEKTVAQNVLKYGTGGINIDESRVEGTYDNEGRNIRQEDYKSEAEFLTALSKEGRKTRSDSNPLGRFPANLLHDNSEEVRECFPNESERFFKSIIYQAKASKKDRGEYNNHPTVKPTPLMEYLVTMVTKKGGVVLDPFNGSGSTGVACVKNGFDYIGIDLSEEYLQISEKRIQSLNN